MRRIRGGFRFPSLSSRCLVFFVACASIASPQGVITTVAGTDWVFPNYPLPALSAPFRQVSAVAVDAKGNVYVADRGNNTVMRIASDGTLTIVAGNGISLSFSSTFFLGKGLSGDGGPATSATLNSPRGLAVDSAGDLYIVDSNNRRVRKVSGGIITTVAGNGNQVISFDGGQATSAGLDPQAVAVDSAGNLYIADVYNNRIRKVSGGIITTVAGNGKSGFSGDGGPATAATLAAPLGVAVDSAGNLYIADSGNHRIRKVSGGTITTVVGNGMQGFAGDGGPATSAAVAAPGGVAVDSNGNLYIADNNRIRKVSRDVITTVAGNGTYGISGDGGPATSAALAVLGVAVDSAGNLFIAEYGNRIREVSGGIITTVAAGKTDYKFAGDGGPARSASLDVPRSVAVDSAGNLFITDAYNNRIRKVSKGIITTVAGNGTYGFSGDGGPATGAQLAHPAGIAVDPAGNLFIADQDNNRIRRVSGGTITTVAGDGGISTTSSIVLPQSIAVDSAGNLYVSDCAGCLFGGSIRKVAEGKITTVPDVGGRGVAADSAGNLYIADALHNRIQELHTSDGTITTVVGNGGIGFLGDGGPATKASLNYPVAVASDSAGNLYIVDAGNGRIRKVSGGMITTVAGNGRYGFSGDGGLATNASLSLPTYFDSEGFAGPFLDFDPLSHGAQTGVAVNPAGNLYVADMGNNRVREVLASPVSVQALPPALSFSAAAGGVVPGAQIVNLSSSVAGLAFTTSASSSWLSVTPSSGAIPAVLQVNVDPSQSAAGSYAGTVTITVRNAVPSTLIVNVSVSVTAAQTGKLGVSNQSLGFSVVQGASSATTQLTVSNQGGGSIDFTSVNSTTSGGNWLQVTPASGSVTPTTPFSLTVEASPGDLGPGTYSGSVVVTSATTGESIRVPATMAISASQRKILLSQTGLTFVGAVQGGSLLPQSFGIVNAGQGSMTWSAQASTLSGGSWLSIDQSSGTVTTALTDVSPVNVSVNPAGLAAGEYYGRVLVTAAGAPNSPQSVSVLLKVLPLGSNPGPEVRPTGLIFIGQAGNSPGSQDVMVSNATNTALTFGSSRSTNSGDTWFVHLPTDATVQPNAPVRMLVQPDYTNLTAGQSYQGTLTLGFQDGTSRVISILAIVTSGAGAGASAKFGAREAGGCTPTDLKVQPTAPDPSSSVALLQPVALRVRVVDNCGTPVTSRSGAVQATFSNGDPPVKLVHENDGNWSGTWQPRSGLQPQVRIQLTAFLGQASGGVVSGNATLTVSLQAGTTAPLTFGAANAASGVGTYISPGGLVSIYGQQLADTEGGGGNAPFPMQLNGTQVLMGGKPLPLRYVGSGQVNAQVPFDLGINTQQQLVVQRGTTLSVPQDVLVAAAQPAVYTQDQSGIGPGVIVNGITNAVITAGNPAKVGDVIVIYCNGLGAVDPAVLSGTPAPPNGPLSRTVNPLSVTIGGVPARVDFAGLAPGYPDLYQVNAFVPAGVTPGDQVPVVLNIAGQPSPPVTIAVR